MTQLIAALATARSPAAIGVLRLSGPGALKAAARVFRGGAPLDQVPDRRLVYGDLLDRDGHVIDRVLATVSRAPHSYTGEDTAELQCHGAPAVLALGLEALYAAGARAALPGEFTKRAFLNGKLDLCQAEAVADLLDAPTGAAVHAAAGQLGGALSRRVEEVYGGLVDLTAHFHAVLDYPDEDLDPFREEELRAGLIRAEEGLADLLASYDRGKFVARGVPCAIVGLPNAGKSSLLNALLGYERAIVTDVPGTTRDTVEELCTLGGVPLRLIDTAGLRETADPVERLGVARSRAALEGAGLALVLYDGSLIPTPEEREAERALWAEAAERAGRSLLVRAKADLPRGEARDFGSPEVVVSARTGQGLDALAQAVAALFPAADPGGAGALLTNARQAEAAGRALECVRAARGGLEAGMTPDAVLTDAEGALGALAELTGRAVREDVVERIFSRFCVGK